MRLAGTESAFFSPSGGRLHLSQAELGPIPGSREPRVNEQLELRRFAGKEPPLNSPYTSYHRALHRFAIFLAVASFLLIVAGALVTSHDAGLSVPDWPTSFGRLPVTSAYFSVPLVGGVLWEHGHRMLAQLIGLLTIILVIWTWRTEARSWVRKLALGALGLVVLQGLFGGATVLLGLPAWVSTVHAALGQSFFCTAVALALFTGRNWSQPVAAVDAPAGGMSGHAWGAVGIVFVQLILGSLFRHHGLPVLPHVIMAFIVALTLLFTIYRVFARYRESVRLTFAAGLLLCLLLVQLGLGILSYMTRLVWVAGEGSQTLMVVSTVAHVAVGALLLATCVALAMELGHRTTVQAASTIGGTAAA
jgi:cytochrome c oxidase assembly protein subunit 15